MFRIENGKKLFSLDMTIDVGGRVVCASQQKPAAPPEGKPAEGDADGIDNAAADTDDGKVHDRWRMISAVQAWPTTSFWDPQMVDYGANNGKVIKDIVKMINQKASSGRPVPLTWDHSHSSKDVAGFVENAKWEDSKDVPPGVNADVVIDPRFDARAALGVQEGYIQSGSIGINMDTTPSHPDMDFEEFTSKQGTKVDGEIVRWLPEKLIDVRHMAFVPAGAGADPNAGKREQSNTRNPHRILEDTTKETTFMNKKILELLQKVFNHHKIDTVLTETSTLSDEVVEALENRMTQNSEAAAKFTKLAARVQALSKAIDAEAAMTADEVLDKLPAVIELADAGKQLIDVKRTDCLSWFDKATVKPDKAELTDAEKRLRGRIEASKDLDYLADLTDVYRVQAEAKFGGTHRSSTGADDIPADSATRSHLTPSDLTASVNRVFRTTDKGAK